MKINEVLQEGPIWQNIKSGAAKVGAGLAGAKAGYDQSKAQREGQAKVIKLARDAEPYWVKIQAAYQQRGVTPNQMGQYLTQWARDWYNVPSIPDYTEVIGAPQVTALGIQKYLQTAASYYIAPQIASSKANATIDDTSANTAGPGAMSAMAGHLGSRMLPVSAASSTGGVTTTSKGVMHQAKASALFQDPVKFKSEFDKYLKSIGDAEINDELKNALKTIWMQAGGTRLESKKYKGKRV